MGILQCVTRIRIRIRIMIRIRIIYNSGRMKRL